MVRYRLVKWDEFGFLCDLGITFKTKDAGEKYLFQLQENLPSKDRFTYELMSGKEFSSFYKQTH